MVIYFSLLGRYSVDALVGDQWDDVAVIKKSYVHFFDWGPMWAQHNENRIFFPNIVVVFLAHTDHFDVRVEEFLSALILTAAVVCILWAHKRRSPAIPWLYYCPVAFLAFSVVQYGNTLWGFQLAWYMVLLCLAAAILLLDRVTLTWMTLVGALVVAVVGSFSSLQGLLIWPSGLVLLYFRRRSLSQVAVWIGSAVLSTLVYFRGYNSPTPDPKFAIEHPLISLRFFLLVMGDVVGKPVINGLWNLEDTLVVLFGLVILLLAVTTVLICGARRDEHSGSPIGIALICYGVLFMAMITQGRIILGYAAASYSRYTTFDLLVVVGIYLALLDRRSLAVDAADLSTSRTTLQSPSGWWRTSRVHGWLDRVALPSARGAVLVAIMVLIPFGLYNGVLGARVLHTQDLAAAAALRNINDVTDGELLRVVVVDNSSSWVRNQAQTLEEHRLSVFANG